MTPHAGTGHASDVATAAKRARQAALRLASVSLEARNAALIAAADSLLAHSDVILAANELDCSTAAPMVEAGRMSPATFARLKTSERGIREMAERVREVAGLPDPLGRVLSTTELDRGLTLRKVSCPLGVIAIIFESRPDVVPQIASLALKSGNAVLLKGGKEARNTNEALFAAWRSAMAQFPDIPVDSVALLHTHDDVNAMLKLHGEIDLIVPRGSKQLVQYVTENSLVPVLGHGDGICHVYVDRAADIEKAVAVAFDAKVQYPSACNAAETLLVHQDIAASFLPPMVKRYIAAGVEVRGCARTRALLPDLPVVAATDADWATEYSDLIISVKVVSSADEAIGHINTFGSKHTESIVTEDSVVADQFMNQVDAAGVYHNASTRFADGYRYGLGSEVGISTGKIHARGPVGLEGLTTYKYKLTGNGHTVAAFRGPQKVKG
jgi:glutamate-5-semialdehyde dehydrogenase